MLGTIDLRKLKPHNNFRFVVRDLKDGSVKEFKAENIVLDEYSKLLAGEYVTNAYNDNLYHCDIHIGSGTGTLDSTRTSLFNQLMQREPVLISRQYAFPTSVGEFMITIGSSELVGQTITEIGISRRRDSYIKLVSHAFITDSEGSVISIGPKTDTQIIEVYVTIYFETTKDQGNFEFITPRNGFAQFALLDAYKDFDIHFHELTFYPTLYWGNTPDPELAVNKTITGSFRLENTLANGFSGLRQSTDITAIGLGYRVSPTAIIKFPNTSIFPIYTFTDKEIGTGDGVKTSFNLESNHYITGSDVIKIDGVEQVRDVDYSIINNGGGFYDLFRHNPLLPTKELTDKNGSIVTSNRLHKDLSPYLVDLKQEVTVKSIYFTVNDFINVLIIEVSTDNINWTTIYDDKPNPNETPHIIDISGIPIQYIRVTAEDSSAYDYVDGFLLVNHDSITFTSPPANGAVITGSWQTDVPFKNANYLYDIDWTLVY